MTATVLDVVSAVLLLAGALQCLVGAVGMVRLPSLLSRMQAATKPQTVGLLLILAGTALRLPPGPAASQALPPGTGRTASTRRSAAVACHTGGAEANCSRASLAS